MLSLKNTLIWGLFFKSESFFYRYYLLHEEVNNSDKKSFLI